MRIKAFILIIFLGFLWRVVSLNKIPLGLYVDDGAIGYNAYSLLMTGKDEYGKTFPIFLKSWNAYTPALVVYFATVPIKLFGLDVVPLRATPVILGTLTIAAVSILIYTISQRRNYLFLFIPSLVMAFNPSHILFSRSFYEATLAFLFWALGLYKLFKNKPIMGMILLALSAYSYHTERLLAPLWVIIFVIYKIYSRKLSKAWVMSVVLFVLLIAPQMYLSFSGGLTTNSLGKSWMSEVTKDPLRIDKHSFEFFSRVLSYYSPSSLFYHGDPDLQRSLPGLSMFTPGWAIPFVLGLWMLVKDWRKNILVILMLATFMLPAALTRDPFSTLRAVIILIPIGFLITKGMWQIHASHRKYFVPVLILIIVTGSLAIYRSLFVLLPHERYEFWNYGLKDMYAKAATYNLPVVVDIDKPVYILHLLYNRIDPLYVQSLNTGVASNYYSQYEWKDYYSDTRFQFRDVSWEQDIYKHQLLVLPIVMASKQLETEHFFTKEYEVVGPDGNVIFVLYQTHPDKKCSEHPELQPGCANYVLSAIDPD